METARNFLNSFSSSSTVLASSVDSAFASYRISLRHCSLYLTKSEALWISEVPLIVAATSLIKTWSIWIRSNYEIDSTNNTLKANGVSTKFVIKVWPTCVVMELHSYSTIIWVAHMMLEYSWRQSKAIAATLADWEPVLTHWRVCDLVMLPFTS
jgi:hypothetical protein